jgi:hypothetical protein
MLVVAFDIETLGKLSETPLPAITCVCLYDGSREERLRFLKVSPETFIENKKKLLEWLDGANSLAGFNAVDFDLEYIRQFFNIDKKRMREWVLKCRDPFMVCRHLLKNTCGLNHLLQINGLASKTGSGSNAIQLALDEKWDDLLDYCMMDTILTFKLCSLPEIAFSSYLRGSMDDGGVWQFYLKKNREEEAFIPASTMLMKMETVEMMASDPTISYDMS